MQISSICQPGIRPFFKAEGTGSGSVTAPWGTLDSVAMLSGVTPTTLDNTVSLSPSPPYDPVGLVVRHGAIGALAGAATSAAITAALDIAMHAPVGTMLGTAALIGGVPGAIAGCAGAAVHSAIKGERGYHPRTAAITGALAGGAGFVGLVVWTLTHMHFG